MRGLPAAELARKGRLSAALLDYWDRTGILRPSGRLGAYTDVEASIALVLGDANRLGVPGPLLAELVEHLEHSDPLDWPPALWVTPAGAVLDAEPTETAWLLRPLERAGDQVMLAVAS